MRYPNLGPSDLLAKSKSTAIKDCLVMDEIIITCNLDRKPHLGTVALGWLTNWVPRDKVYLGQHISKPDG